MGVGSLGEALGDSMFWPAHSSREFPKRRGYQSRETPDTLYLGWTHSTPTPLESSLFQVPPLRSCLGGIYSLSLGSGGH